ncbi:DUF6768 family protein [Paraurantiacibacter namhicola]|uniref:Uncharacterized protein n=1 Tax=Paraurantiacibacter namhicola TaxID=645517 RepID=A0A1C7D7E0_9SPHN|nr:DUF6768 family protein [Paraurantiacibacter namhicola]ANU07390.1 hypothetical protein A6F65_01081 [Paraurantiacibacter namhicola]
MSKTDENIAAALDADDRAFLRSLDDRRGLFSQMGDAMAGPLGGWAKFMFAIMFVLGAGLIYSIWQLVTVADTDARILWAVATLGLLTAQGFAKEWFFNRMNLLAMLREMKRLQLQVAMLAEERA